MDGVKLVSSAILGVDMETVMINGSIYHIYPPTIRKFVGAVSAIKEPQGETVKDIILGLDLDGASEALSWFVAGNKSLKETFMDAKIDEVLDALLVAFGMIDPQNFIRLSALLRNVRSLIAKPK